MIYSNNVVPLIIVNDSGFEHIFGTTLHDLLYVDKESGGIQYINIQCHEGTEKRISSKEQFNTYFVELDYRSDGRGVNTINNMIVVSTQTYIYMTKYFLGYYKEGFLLSKLHEYLDNIAARWTSIEQDYTLMKESKNFKEIGLVYEDDVLEELEDFWYKFKETEEQSIENKKLAMWLQKKGCRVFNEGQKWIITIS